MLPAAHHAIEKDATDVAVMITDFLNLHAPENWTNQEITNDVFDNAPERMVEVLIEQMQAHPAAVSVDGTAVIDAVTTALSDWKLANPNAWVPADPVQ